MCFFIMGVRYIGFFSIHFTITGLKNIVRYIGVPLYFAQNVKEMYNSCAELIFSPKKKTLCIPFFKPLLVALLKLKLAHCKDK